MRHNRECDGEVLTGGYGEYEHQYCDKCHAFTHDMDAEELPSGTNEAANRKASDNGEYASIDASEPSDYRFCACRDCDCREIIDVGTICDTCDYGCSDALKQEMEIEK